MKNIADSVPYISRFPGKTFQQAWDFYNGFIKNPRI